jgi:cytoskeletal protein CcmA (bactofilin family)
MVNAVVHGGESACVEARIAGFQSASTIPDANRPEPIADLRPGAVGQFRERETPFMFRRKKDNEDQRSGAGDTIESMNADKGIPRASGAQVPAPAIPRALAQPAQPMRNAMTVPARAGAAAGSDNEGKKLIVGREIMLSGEITSCDKLVVEGRVEAKLSESRAIEIAESGHFKGTAEIDQAEIGGRFEGTITVHQRLFIRSTGRVIGTIRYGQIEIEPGGEISGDVQVDNRGAAD